MSCWKSIYKRVLCSEWEWVCVCFWANMLPNKGKYCRHFITKDLVNNIYFYYLEIIYVVCIE